MSLDRSKVPVDGETLLLLYMNKQCKFSLRENSSNLWASDLIQSIIHHQTLNTHEAYENNNKNIIHLLPVVVYKCANGNRVVSISRFMLKSMFSLPISKENIYVVRR